MVEELLESNDPKLQELEKLKNKLDLNLNPSPTENIVEELNLNN